MTVCSKNLGAHGPSLAYADGEKNVFDSRVELSLLCLLTLI